jgi:hypothetical protein
VIADNNQPVDPELALKAIQPTLGRFAIPSAAVPEVFGKYDAGHPGGRDRNETGKYSSNHEHKSSGLSVHEIPLPCGSMDRPGRLSGPSLSTARMIAL